MSKVARYFILFFGKKGCMIFGLTCVEERQSRRRERKIK
jgi:hypothetical protein